MLAPGTKLGPYEIVAPLGAGGMGEVYRAKDTRLGREVAVKVLPRHLSDVPEVRARFEREARTVSSLNHPNICTLFDVGRSPGEAGSGEIDYLVMELVEGETLAQRLHKGPLQVAEVLTLGAQVADALDRAHRAGVIHRDLKPGNVMLTRAGAKLMDFGLARAAGLVNPVSGSGATKSALAQSPTVGQPLTAEGTIVGTFQYMSPEQLEGREADARSDLWALGCVLYEMATGKRAYEGATQASLISAIMRDSPRPIAELAPMSPPALERLVAALLAKDPDERVQTAHDVKLQLRWAAEPISTADSRAHALAAPAAARRGRSAVLAWTVAGLASAAALALAAMLALARKDAAPVHATILPPSGGAFSSTSTLPIPLAISPDGSRVTFCAHAANGPDGLWVRALDSDEPHILAGTEEASMPFFSPDGKSIAFFASGKLKRVAADGGPVTTLADAEDPRGGSWGKGDVIVFAPSGTTGLSMVGAQGGPVTVATTLDPARNEATHRYPYFLPDGRHFLFLARRAGAGKGEEPAIYAASIGSPRRTRVLGVASNVAYASGHLVYVDQGNLVAQAFDPARFTVSGAAIPISDSVRWDQRFSRGTFAVSRTGVLVYMSGQAQERSQLRWADRRGTTLRTVGEPGEFTFGGTPQLDPSGRRSAMGMLNSGTGISDIWIVDLDTGGRRRLSVDEEDHYACAWSADGRQVFMNSLLRKGGSEVLALSADGTGSAKSVASWPQYVYPESGSPDGRWLLASWGTSGERYDVVALPTDGVGKALPVATGPANQFNARFSPDGKHVAYASNESGRFEVYVTTFPPPGSKWQASQKGGWQPRWNGDGSELFFVDPENYLTALKVTRSGAGLEFGSAQRLFQIYGASGLTLKYDVARDGGSFLLTGNVDGTSARPLTLVTNWIATLHR
jgi:Tol biopolymer transport system component